MRGDKLWYLPSYISERLPSHTKRFDLIVSGSQGFFGDCAWVIRKQRRTGYREHAHSVDRGRVQFSILGNAMVECGSRRPSDRWCEKSLGPV